MNNSIIDVKVKSNYGRVLVYPLDNVREWQTILGGKTFTEAHRKSLKILGFTFKIVGLNTL